MSQIIGSRLASQKTAPKKSTTQPTTQSKSAQNTDAGENNIRRKKNCLNISGDIVSNNTTTVEPDNSVSNNVSLEAHKELKKEYAQLLQEHEHLEKRVQKLTQRYDAELSNLKQENARITNDLNQAKELIEIKHSQISKLSAENSRLSMSITKVSKMLSEFK
jgi:chromosome segregation ATPase